VPDGTPHFRRNVHGGIVVVVVGEVVVVVPKMVVVVVPKLVVVVELVVVVVKRVVPHAGSAGFVQEQNVSPLILHSATTALLQSLKAAPDKLPHAAATSSAHCFEPQSEGAALAPETKTPAASATAANVTTTLLVIVSPPMAVPMLRSISALYRPGATSSTRLSKGGKSRKDAAARRRRWHRVRRTAAASASPSSPTAAHATATGIGTSCSSWPVSQATARRRCRRLKTVRRREGLARFSRWRCRSLLARLIGPKTPAPWALHEGEAPPSHARGSDISWRHAPHRR
jgi:hypothetical protein